MRVAFIDSLDQQTLSRLQVLARAGLRTATLDNRRLIIDPHDISNTALLARDQGLSYFNPDRQLLASEGLVPSVGLGGTDGSDMVESGGRTFHTFAIPIEDPTAHRRVGTVRASESDAERERDIALLDRGLAVGTILAIVGSALGGLILARRAVAPVARSFRMLREFTADASHELHGPLTAIAFNADAALRDTDRDPLRDRSRFEAIADGAKQMARLTSDLLLLAGAARSLEREMFVVDVATVLKSIRTVYDPQFNAKSIALAVLQTEPAIVYGNPDQVERIVGNLVQNALNYTPRGGSVAIEVTRDRSHVFVGVRDNGVGISPLHLERIFDRFWRADPARSKGGSGLGLAIARALARRHGGDVTVTSRFGSGSEFVASFPTRPPRID